MHLRSKVESGVLALGLITLATSGCAAGVSSRPQGLGAGEWRVTLPATKSYSQGLAYGRGGSGARVQTDADAPLLAQAHTAPVAAESKPVQRKRRADQVAPTTTTQPSAPAPEETPVVPPVARNERTELAFADTSTTVGRYEARQAQSQSQQAFAGGDAIIIGASTLVIVILIVLLVLLLV